MKIKERIERLLEKDPECRNNDKWLTYCVFQEIAIENDQKIFIPFNLFSKFPAFETVKRTRAQIQNTENRFLPEDRVPETENQGEITQAPNNKLANSWMS